MKRALFLPVLAAAVMIDFATAAAQTTSAPEAVPSETVLYGKFGADDVAAFADPPKVFRPQTWFHYVGGNVSTEGITADLEAISAAGFSGVQLFHGQAGYDGMWPGNDSRITCLSERWDDAVRHTAAECRRLGLRFTMQGCPGWAMAGGPWIKPENAMRHLAWSRTDVECGDNGIVLPLPDGCADEWRDYRDVAVLAFPTPAEDTGRPLVPLKAEGSVGADWMRLLGGGGGEALRLAPTTPSEPYTVDVWFDGGVCVRTLEFPCVQALNHAWCYEPSVRVRVEAFDASGNGVEVLDTELPQSNWQDDRPLTLSCREAEGAVRYRVSLVNGHDIVLPYLRFYSGVRKNSWESEAGWTLRSIERRGQEVSYDDRFYVNPDDIVDLTDLMSTDGSLAWQVPAGRWTILRIGDVNTGMKNGPAPAEGTGWECDKLSTAGSDAQFEGYLGRLTADGGPIEGMLDGVLFDSWECKTQTWTPEMEAEFGRRAGYPLRRWMPALMGYVVGDTESTTRFLNDWRRTVGDMVAENFFGNMARHAASRGMSIAYETAAGDVFPADIMAYYRYADVPMCEFWQPLSEGYVGSLDFKPVKPAASAAHLYGKPRLAAEAFTSFSHTWDEDWRDLKQVANVNMAEGVTHLVFHTYTHNPQVGFLPPGTSFAGAGIGTPFLRGQTWWRHMPEFTTYLARCSYMLERGCPANDVLWYLGDEVDHKPPQHAPFPKGFRYDYCNTDVLMTRLEVRDGCLVTPEGVEYAVLWLPETTRMLPETAERIEALVRAGATVAGEAPRQAATLRGGRSADKRVERVAARLWGRKAGKGVRRVGRGRVISRMPLGEALAVAGLRSDVETQSADGNVMWLHRKAEGADIYFVAAPVGGGFDGEVRFRCGRGRVQVWDPVSGTVTDMAGAVANGITSVRLSLPQSGCCFVVFTEGESRPAPEMRAEVSDIPTDGWTVRFPEGWGAPDSLSLGRLAAWRDMPMSEEGRAFSGTARYETTFEAERCGDGQRLVLSLGKVERIAEVRINGHRVGTLWTYPYEADITDFVVDGRNTLTVDVTGSWFNRLVYDAGRPEAGRKTWVLRWPDRNAPLRESGLLGPVILRRETPVKQL